MAISVNYRPIRLVRKKRAMISIRIDVYVELLCGESFGKKSAKLFRLKVLLVKDF